MAIRVTQFANEVWVSNYGNIRVTQFGNEVWGILSVGNIRVTQFGIETWRGVADAPLLITGHADGISRNFAYTSAARPTEGEADGYATAASLRVKYYSPIMVVMGI